jgi:hypothetical protein
VAQQSNFSVSKTQKCGHFSVFFFNKILPSAAFRPRLLERKELSLRQLLMKKNLRARVGSLVFENYLLCNFGEKWPISAKNGQNLAK